MKYILGRALVVIKLHSPTRGSATSTWQSVECLTPAEPLKFLINFFDEEDDDGFQVPVYFGGPFVSDDVLMRKLETLVC
jgi:hypothetical protein